MSQITLTTSGDTLPKQFVFAMRTLFDIMDDKKTGYIKLTDIENRWRDDRTKGLPKGVIESLQKVTPHDGLLTFERFCTGLKICLLKNQVVTSRTNPETQILQTHRVPNSLHQQSTGLLGLDESPTSHKSDWNSNENGNADSPLHQALTTIGVPYPNSRQDHIVSVQVHRYKGDELTANGLYGPPKPPRLTNNIHINNSNPEKSEILPHVQTWKTSNENPVLESKNTNGDYANDSLRYLTRGGRGPGDGKSANDPVLQHKKTIRRREPRRHTLQNGIDYNMLKRLKQIEQERDILMQGLAAIDNAREWYLKQLAEVQEKMRYTSRMGTHVEPWSESQQERLELQRARVLELNRQLAALAENWQRGGLSLHMNLALSSPPISQVRTNQTSNRLKHQNHLLTEEVTKKSERISVLEREKSALIRELLTVTKRNNGVENVY